MSKWVIFDSDEILPTITMKEFEENTGKNHDGDNAWYMIKIVT